MRRNNLVAIEGHEQEDGLTVITRALDLGAPQPVEADGGDVVFAPVLERTTDGAALEPTGEDLPVATTSVYSERDLRGALADAGYSHEAVDHALAVRLDGATGRRAASIAESRTHDHPAQVREGEGESEATVGTGEVVATDGGGPTDELLPGNAALADSETASEHGGVLVDAQSRGCDTCTDDSLADLKAARLPDGMVAQVCPACFGHLPGRSRTTTSGYPRSRVGAGR